MTEQKKTDDWLIKNAISCWLYHFPAHPWTSRYEELVKRDTFITETEVQGRRRPAKRARQTKASTKETTTGSKTQPSS